MRSQLPKRNISYTLKVSKRARRMRLTVRCDGACVVTVPRQMNKRLAEEFVAKKSVWISDKLDYFKKFTGQVFVKSSKKHFAEHKASALALAEKRIEHFNSSYHFRVNKIQIRNQKTRWGSCSRKGNLNFNYKIALLPPHLADYIVVHELCHLGEFNHSKKFWDLVAKTVPDYRALRKELKKSRLGFS